MRVRQLAPVDAPQLASWVRNICCNAKSHCLSTFAGESEAELATSLETQLRDSLSYLVLEDGERWLATMGCDVKRERAFGWLQGPHVPEPPPMPGDFRSSGDERAAIRAEMGRAMQEHLHGVVGRVASYVAISADELLNYYRTRGFRQNGVSHALRLDRDAFSTDRSDPHVGPHLMPQRKALLEQLYAAFPGAKTTSTEADIIERKSWKSYVAVNDGHVIGFIVFGGDGEQVAEIKYLAVLDEHRRRGWGRRLLHAATAELARTACQRVLLVVHDRNVQARTFYESVGFRLAFSGAPLWGELANLA